MQNDKRVIFLGSKKSGLNCLKAIYNINPTALVGVITIDDREDSRSSLYEIIAFCKINSIEIKIAKSKYESERCIKFFKPDLAIVFGWYWIISHKVINESELGFIGVHYSILPKYRGCSPLVWSIINGDEEIGFSVFSLTKNMDEGDIWYQYKRKLNNNDDIGNILQEFDDVFVTEIQTLYPNILKKNLKPSPQNKELATYCKQRKPIDGLINWSENATNVFNFIRAQSKPYPGAFSYYFNEKLIIWKSRIYSETISNYPCGIFIKINNSIIVSCGNNTAIELLEVNYLNHDGNAISIFKKFNIQTN